MLQKQVLEMSTTQPQQPSGPPPETTNGPASGPPGPPGPPEGSESGPPGPDPAKAPGPMNGPPGPRPSAPNQSQIQKMLDENSSLIKTISDYQNMGRHHETMNYQWQLHRNLMQLAQMADANQNLQNLLPPPGQVNHDTDISSYIRTIKSDT